MKKSSHRNTRLSVSLVLPVFNNEKTIMHQLQECQRIMQRECNNYEIVISNDASTDNTKKILNGFAKQKNIYIYHQKINLGIAKNLQFLYKQATYPYILLYSVDGDWNPQDVQRLIVHAYEKNVDIVIGKRVTKDYSMVRKIVSYLYNLLPVILFRVRTYDTGSIKIFKKDILTLVPISRKSVSFEAEMLIKALKKGHTFSTIPIMHKKHTRKKKSGVNIKLIVVSFWDLIKLRMQNI